MGDLSDFYGDLASIISYGANSILGDASIQLARFGVPCSNISNVVIAVNARIAEIFEKIANSLVTARENVMRFS